MACTFRNQPTQVYMDQNSRDLQQFEHGAIMHHVRDAIVSGNTFDVPINQRCLKQSRAFLWHIGLRRLVNIAVMNVTYELQSYPVLGTGMLLV